MKLHWSPRSPFVRKVMVAAHELDLVDRIARVRTVVAMAEPNHDLLPDNPLGKIPTLVLEDGTALPDSLLICEYLDHLDGNHRLIPSPGADRWQALRWHALADGALDLLILWRNERERVQPLPALLDAFALKANATLGALDSEVDAFGQTPFGLAQITIAVLGGYLDFRFAALGWRARYPRLAAWQDSAAERPSMRATQVVDA